MASPWIDLTLPISPASIAWAGLAPPRLEWLAHLDRGDAVTVGALDCCLHTGTHADAPLHVEAGGRAVAALDPSAYIGPALVVRSEDDHLISLDELRAAIASSGGPTAAPERLLIATPRPYDGMSFPAAIPTLALDAVEYLIEMGLRLVGVNVPSLDPLDSRTLAVHKALFGAGVGVLENLDLTQAEPGWYELVAPPLKIFGADASPVRALARRLAR